MSRRSGTRSPPTRRTTVVAYFANSNGIFVGDEVRILGVAVGKIDKIEPQPERVKITFWFDGKYQVPADAKAVILSPSLVTARAIQLTPAYTGGPQLQNDAVIPQERTAVPVEWDDLRQDLEKLTQMLQPTHGGVSPLGSLVTTAANNLRGQGATIRDTHHQALPSGFRARRPQQRSLQHREEPVDPGFGAAEQR